LPFSRYLACMSPLVSSLLTFLFRTIVSCYAANLLMTPLHTNMRMRPSVLLRFASSLSQSTRQLTAHLLVHSQNHDASPYYTVTQLYTCSI
jgi:hypothetical protein